MEEMNKRKNKRQACFVPVDGKRGGPFFHARTVDISKNGVGLVAQKRLPVNEEITLQLDLSLEDIPVLVRGEVKWVKPMEKSRNYRIGLLFKNIYTGSKLRLNQYFRGKT